METILNTILPRKQANYKSLIVQYLPSIKRQWKHIRKAICKLLQKPGKGNRKSRLLTAYFQGSVIASCWHNIKARWKPTTEKFIWPILYYRSDWVTLFRLIEASAFFSREGIASTWAFHMLTKLRSCTYFYLGAYRQGATTILKSKKYWLEHVSLG